jgi:hypothetical protein
MTDDFMVAPKKLEWGDGRIAAGLPRCSRIERTMKKNTGWR